MWPGQSAHKLECVGSEASDHRLRASHTNIISAQRQAISKLCLQLHPFLQQATRVELAQQARLGDGIGGLAKLVSSTGHITKVIVTLIAQDRVPSHQRERFVFRRTLVVLEIPKFDMSIANGDKVVAILGKRDRLHLDSNLVRGDDVIVAPVPDINQHVVLGAHRYDILRIGRECLNGDNTKEGG